MASQISPPSRLVLMQIKFQQKQLLEREQRRSELFGAVSNKEGEDSDSVMSNGCSNSNGKVRQMFDQRRRGAGVDRSQPLKPITASGTITKSPTVSVRSNVITTAPSKTTKMRSMHVTEELKSCSPSNVIFDVKVDESITDGNDNCDLVNNNTVKDIFNMHPLELALSNNNNIDPKHNDYSGNMNNSHELLIPKATKTPIRSTKNVKSPPTSFQLRPLVTKKSPTTAVTTLQRSSNRGAIISSNTMQRTVTNASKSVNKPPLKKSPRPMKMAQSIAATNSAPRIVPPPEGMATCRFCNRNFIADRLQKHEAVCQKLSTAKRKVFDASQHRVRGTEAEKYLKKGIRNVSAQSSNKNATSYTNAPTVKSASPNSALKKSNWRQKHEEFIAAIRAAKQVKAHLARGGKLADLPPPPPSENPDYIQCPHCSRRFNQAAAERHIPKCANMLHNKPKPKNSKPSTSKGQVTNSRKR